MCILCSCDGNVYLHWLYIDGLSDFVRIVYQDILDVVFISTIQSVLAVFTHFILFSLRDFNIEVSYDLVVLHAFANYL